MQPVNRINRIAITFFLAALSFGVGAHPHSFIRLQTQVVSENDRFVALKMRWTMDEITSADLLYDAGNAKPGSEIWKKLAAEVMANVLGQHYFTEIWHNGQKVKFKNRPTEYGMARDEERAVLTFVLPLAEPQPLNGQTYTLATFDPTYYVDMHYDRPQDFTLPAELQTNCKVDVVTPQPNDKMLTYAQSLDKADAPPEDMDLGDYFAQKVTLQCQ